MTRLLDPVPERAVFVFDGWCGFCTRSTGWMRWLDRHHRLDWVPAQDPSVGPGAGLDDEWLVAAAWVVVPDGRRVGGAAVVAAAIAIALGTRLPLMPWRVPALARLLDTIYGCVARNRRRLPGTTPWCAEHPDACGGTGAGDAQPMVTRPADQASCPSAASTRR